MAYADMSKHQLPCSDLTNVPSIKVTLLKHRWAERRVYQHPNIKIDIKLMVI